MCMYACMCTYVCILLKNNIISFVLQGSKLLESRVYFIHFCFPKAYSMDFLDIY